jgi:hypothetical protein
MIMKSGTINRRMTLTMIQEEILAAHLHLLLAAKHLQALNMDETIQYSYSNSVDF